MRITLRSLAFFLFSGLATSATAAGSDGTYRVPIPAADADRLAPWSSIATDAKVRIDAARGTVRLKYRLPSELTGARSIEFDLSGETDGRDQFVAGDVVKVRGMFDDHDADDEENTPARATCIFVTAAAVDCTVTYDSIELDAAAQSEWLMHSAYSAVDAANFAEVRTILGHEAIGVLSAPVRINE